MAAATRQHGHPEDDRVAATLSPPVPGGRATNLQPKEIPITSMSMNLTTVPYEVVTVGDAELWCWKLTPEEPGPLTSMVLLPCSCDVCFACATDAAEIPELTLTVFDVGDQASKAIFTGRSTGCGTGPQPCDRAPAMVVFELRPQRSWEPGDAEDKEDQLAVIELRRVDKMPGFCAVIHCTVERRDS